ncbi:hypothetical protein [Halorussus caseinilyticus]|uniref:Uncharacterized protein n=1 Tax=Halorussus caseinilyticus TaxID=3034025 RepID=A0ABD5WRL1_9EURY|nr:hypothetical protein [Halorussus sp. DT72]
MSHEVTSRYRVKEIVESQGDVWLEDLHPQRSGFLVAVEMNAQYDRELDNRVQGLDEGDTVIATLKSQDKRHTVWHFSNIDDEPSKQSSQAVAQS